MHHELIQILGLLTDDIQELGWYSLDLEEAAEKVDRLPGMGAGTQQVLDRHRQRVARLSDNGKDVRAEAKDALSHYSDIITGRQAQVINALTIVTTVSFAVVVPTGYFGMKFRILTTYVQTTFSQFILLGLLLMIVSAALSLLLIHRLERRLRVGGIGQLPSWPAMRSHPARVRRRGTARARMAAWRGQGPADPSPVTPLSAAERGEHWWPVALAIIAVVGMYVALPAKYRVNPTWVVPVVLLGCWPR